VAEQLSADQSISKPKPHLSLGLRSAMW